MQRRRLSSERPRDALGRPLAWGAVNELVLDDYDNLSVEENHRLACGAFGAGSYFPAHEAWETAWKQSKGAQDEEFFKGLSQMAAGYTHLLRGNQHGAVTLLDRAAARIGASSKGQWGLDTEAIAERCRRDRDAISAGQIVVGIPLLDPPRMS